MSVYEKRKRSIIEDLDWNGSSYTASRLLKLLRQTLSLAITLYLTIYVSKINLKSSYSHSEDKDYIVWYGQHVVMPRGNFLSWL